MIGRWERQESVKIESKKIAGTNEIRSWKSLGKKEQNIEPEYLACGLKKHTINDWVNTVSKHSEIIVSVTTEEQVVCY